MTVPTAIESRSIVRLLSVNGIREEDFSGEKEVYK